MIKFQISKRTLDALINANDVISTDLKLERIDNYIQTQFIGKLHMD